MVWGVRGNQVPPAVSLFVGSLSEIPKKRAMQAFGTSCIVERGPDRIAVRDHILAAHVHEEKPETAIVMREPYPVVGAKQQF